MKKFLFDSRIPGEPGAPNQQFLVFSGTDAETLWSSGPMSGRTANAELVTLLDPESSQWAVQHA